MAFENRSRNDVEALEAAIEEHEEEHGNNSFTDGALAVVKWLIGEDEVFADEVPDVAAFVKEYLSVE